MTIPSILVRLTRLKRRANHRYDLFRRCIATHIGRTLPATRDGLDGLHGALGNVTRAAKRYLLQLEEQSLTRGDQTDLFAGAAPAPESEPHPALDLLASIKPDELSPKEALELLYKLKKL